MTENEKIFFIHEVTSYIDLTKEEIDFFVSCFELCEIDKRSLLLNQDNSTENFDAFVLQGIFRAFCIDKDYNQTNLYFSFEGYWISELTFISQSSCKLNLQALEKSRILKINQTKKNILIQKLPKAEKLFNSLIKKAYISLQQRMLSTLNKTAEHRYNDVIVQFPTIEKRIAQHHIASYLGISPEFLSKIKKKVLLQRKKIGDK